MGQREQAAGRVPPAAIDAEAAVLSTLMLQPETYDDVQRILQPEHFYDPRHHHIFRAISELHETQRPVNLISVAQTLRSSERMEQVGGASYLAEVQDATPAVAHVEDHARIVRDKWRIRSAIALCQRVAAEGYGFGGLGTDLDAWLADISTMLDGIGRGVDVQTLRTLTELVRREVDAVRERQRLGTQFSGFTTGIAELDRMVNGLKRRNKYEIAARPGIGKTGCMLSIAIHFAETGYGVVIISIEMDGEQMAQRAIAQVAMIDIHCIESGKFTDKEHARYVQAVTRLQGLPLVIDDAAHQTVHSIRSAVRKGVKRLQEERPGVDLALICIDYLQIVKRNGGALSRNEARELGDIANETKAMAKEFNCVVLELSQLNRDLEKRGPGDKRPQLSDLRASGEIEETAFGVFMLHREDYYRKPDEQRDGAAEILVRKLRQGGDTGVVKCQFHGPSTRFFDIPEEQQPSLYGDLDDRYDHGS